MVRIFGNKPGQRDIIFLKTEDSFRFKNIEIIFYSTGNSVSILPQVKCKVKNSRSLFSDDTFASGAIEA